MQNWRQEKRSRWLADCTHRNKDQPSTTAVATATVSILLHRNKECFFFNREMIQYNHICPFFCLNIKCTVSKSLKEKPVGEKKKMFEINNTWNCIKQVKFGPQMMRLVPTWDQCSLLWSAAKQKDQTNKQNNKHHLFKTNLKNNWGTLEASRFRSNWKQISHSHF